MKLKNKLTYFPFAIDLKGANSLVVGGGNIAERKTLSLHNIGSLVKIVSPNITPLLKSMVNEKKITWIKRNILKKDTHNARIIIAATNNSKINMKVSRWAKENNVWVNVVDNPILSNFISPAILYQDKAIIAVYTNGKDPILSRDLKNYLKDSWNEFLSYRNRL